MAQVLPRLWSGLDRPVDAQFAYESLPARERQALVQDSQPLDLVRLALTLEQVDHDLTCEEWAAFLVRYYREDFADPPPPRDIAQVLPGSTAKIKVLTERVECGLHLYHPHDLQTEACDAIGREVRTRRNGSIAAGRLKLLKDLLSTSERRAM